VAIRKLQILGRGTNGSTSVGIPLDKSELRQDELVDEDGEPVDVPIVISRESRGRYVVEALDGERNRS
jgi:hypothetical protein